MDITNKNLGILFTIGDETIYLTQTFISTWVVMGLLIIFAVVVRIMLPRFKPVPGKFQNVVETLVETMSNFARTTMGPKLEVFGGIFFSLFAFIILSNFSGLFGLRPPTADLATTAALGMTIFFFIHFSGIYWQRGKYLKSYFEPVWVFFPINLVGEISRPISLSFRLFGNILGGYIILNLVYSMLPIVLRFIFPNILHAFFDIFAGSMQAFIFTVLSMTFIQQKAVLDEE